LKESKFVITTNDEADVCKEAIMCVTQKAEELKQMIEEVKDFNERVQNLETNMSEKVEELTTDLCKRIGKVESDVSVLKSDVSAVTEVYHFVMISLLLYISILSSFDHCQSVCDQLMHVSDSYY
jgi:tetrahydromethanopterin S-methyltransferase subunit G